jgi:TorA maturation chaperone TorD
MNNLQWAENLIAHHLAFTFLSQVFYEQPTLEFLQSITRPEDALFEDWPLELDLSPVDSGLALLQQFAAGWHDDQLTALRRDYARLFVGPDKLLATPWESVYRSTEGIVFERQTLEVRAMYREFGMPIPHLGKEPDDHIGLELRFVAHLCAVGLDAIQQGSAAQLQTVLNGLERFFAEHLSQWADQCLVKVSTQAQTDYYRGAARLASACIAYSTGLFVRPSEASEE